MLTTYWLIPQSTLVLPLRRLVFCFKLHSRHHERKKVLSILGLVGKVSLLPLWGVICLGETEAYAEARSPVTGDGGRHCVGDTLAPAHLCLSHSSICLPGPRTATPTKVCRYTFCGTWLENMLSSPRSQNGKARNNCKLLAFDVESRAHRGKTTGPRSQNQPVATWGLRRRLVALCSHCTSLPSSPFPTQAAVKMRDSTSVAFSTARDVTCLDFLDRIQNMVGPSISR